MKECLLNRIKISNEKDESNKAKSWKWLLFVVAVCVCVCAYDLNFSSSLLILKGNGKWHTKNFEMETKTFE